MTSFPLYSEAELVDELRRIARLVSDGPLTKAVFDQLSEIHSVTPLRRFGGWRQALEAADLGDRYSGRTVSTKMRTVPSRLMSEADMLAELRRVAALNDRPVRLSDVTRHSPLLSEKVLRSRFGSWSDAVRRAGLRFAGPGSIWTDEQLKANLDTVRAELGRDPRGVDLQPPLSPITAAVYRYRFGSLRQAINFLDATGRRHPAGCRVDTY